MARIEQNIEIAASPNEVFLFFVPQRMTYWYGSEMSSEFEVSGGASDFAVSQKVRITGKIGKKEISHTAVITRYEWLRILEWRFEDAYGVRGLERWQLEPSGNGTRVTMRSEYQMPGTFGRAIDWLITRHAVARRNREYLARLRKYAERR
jgi:Polyketide cyclase / dehydrase and lipid transport